MNNKHSSGGPTTKEQKLSIDKLHEQGKTVAEIRDILNLTFAQIYRRVNREKRKEYDAKYNSNRPKPISRDKDKGTTIITTSSDKYVDTGRPMPPAYKSELKIIVDKDLAKLACKQMGLPDPICTLAERPNSYCSTGWVRQGSRWVAGQEISNNGRVIGKGVAAQL